MNEVEQKRLKDAFADVSFAAKALKAATNLLAEFGENVPMLNSEAIEMFGKEINDLAFSVGFLQSFLRLSVLKQIVKPKETTKQ